jgi:peptidoglycan/LPS O-acetylase OafA/YrhL
VNLLISSDDDLNNFDAIRLAMALLVVWSHSFALYHPAGEMAEPISIITNGHYNAGNIAVMVFFTISGFLICESYLKTKNTFRFLLKRIRRIYPGYMVATAIGALVVVPLFSTVNAISASEIAKTIGLNLLLRDYAPPSNVFARNYSQTLNGSLWSIPFEFWCYIGLAALGAFKLLTKRWLITGIVVLSVIIRVALDVLDKKPGLGVIGDIFGWPYLWLSILPCFFAGTAFFLFKSTITRNRLVLFGLIISFFLACHVPIDYKWQTILAEATFPAVTAYSTFYFSFSNSIKVRQVAAYGDFSYGTYLFAFPIQQMIASSFLLSFPFFLGTSLLLSLGAGLLSWNLVEKWFLAGREKPRVGYLSNYQIVGDREVQRSRQAGS